MSKKSKTIFAILLLIIFVPTFFIFSNTDILFKNLYRFAPKEADEFSRDYIDLVRMGKIAEAEELLIQEAKTSETFKQLEDTSNYITSQEPYKYDLVGWNIFTSGDIKRSTLSYQLQMEDRILLVNIVVNEIDNRKQVYGMNVQSIETPLEVLNNLTFKDKSTVHYSIIAISLGLILFTFYTAARCFDMSIKKKWLWMLFILSGIGEVNLNWTNGTVFLKLISFGIPIATVSKTSLYAPWIFSFYLPVGAVIFWHRLYKINKKAKVDGNSGIQEDHRISTDSISEA